MFLPTLLAALLHACTDAADTAAQTAADDTTAEDSASAVPPPAVEDYDFYFGDLHAHTGLSGDGGSSDFGDCVSDCGALATLVEDARARGMDFMSITDHLNGSVGAADSLRYDQLLATLLAADVPGEFVIVPGAELFFSHAEEGSYGHKNLYFFGDDAQLTDLSRAAIWPDQTSEVDSCQAIWRYQTGMEDRFGPTMLIPHHPSSRLYTDWLCGSPDHVEAVEVYSRHGNSLGPSVSYDPMFHDITPEGSVHGAMDPEGMAWKMGFVGGTDSHDTRPGAVCELDTQREEFPYGGGYTGVLLERGELLDRGAIHRALSDRRVYATSGIRMPALGVIYINNEPAGLTGERFGLERDDDVRFEVQVSEEHDGFVQEVELYMTNRIVPMEEDGPGRWSWRSDGGTVPLWAYAELVIDGDAWYGEDGCEDGGEDRSERVWLSPSWFFLSQDTSEG